MTYRCCARTREPITPLIPKSILVSSSALWRCANTHLRTSTGRQGRGQFSITYLVIRNCWRKTSPFRAQHVPVFRVLRKFGCILDAPHRSHRPQERPDPLEEIQLDAEGCNERASRFRRQTAAYGRDSQFRGCWNLNLAHGRGPDRFSCRDGFGSGDRLPHPVWASSLHDL